MDGIIDMENYYLNNFKIILGCKEKTFLCNVFEPLIK